jgi:hypothetical protein
MGFEGFMGSSALVGGENPLNITEPEEPQEPMEPD